METFTYLNHCSPGTLNATRLDQQSQRSSPHHAQAPNIQSMDQTRPGDGHASSSFSGMTHSYASLGFTGHDLRPQQKRVLVDPHSAVRAYPMKTFYTDDSVNLSDQYIPSSSDKITCTDHRPLDEIFGNMRPSSSFGWSGHVPHASQNATPPSHPWHPPMLTYALPTKPQLDGVLYIPLLAVDNQMSGTGLVVDFRCSDWGIGVRVEGIPMSDLLHGNVSALESPHQRVLDGLGITHLRFHILWPHYPPFAKVLSGFGTDGKPMTRAQLGYEVSLAFAEFFYHITSHRIPSAHLGPYVISSSSPGSSSPGIKFDQLHLITVRNTSRGEWMAEIRAVTMMP